MCDCESFLVFEESKRLDYSLENASCLSDILNIKIGYLISSGKLDEAIAEIKDVLIPLRKTMKQVHADNNEQLFILLASLAACRQQNSASDPSQEE